jgi:very-long-chain enoyl-CoA reductase
LIGSNLSPTPQTRHENNKVWKLIIPNYFFSFLVQQDIKMKVTIASRNPKSSKFPVQLELSGSVDSLKTSDLNKALAKKFPTYYPDRQRLTTEDKKVLDVDKTLKEQGITENTTVYFKDLGPQIGWRTVFMIEYGGPLLIHPIFYYLGKYIYGASFQHSTMQVATYYMVMAHFLKRELETVFVHRFSHGTMPFFNVFKNSAHYWFLSGANLAYFVYGPWFAQGKAAAIRSDVWLYGAVAVWAVS